ncbi:MAG TPA: DUF2934 domain-containing protein, partial [Candidatus Melainabacteria bacterium]|nr:DUF2934 domain-containing protein [Candidatus Melainabacteria bacterium]
EWRGGGPIRMSGIKDKAKETKDDKGKHKNSGHDVVHATPVRLELVSERAYALYEKRGCVHGFALQDWLEAEKQLSLESIN